MALLWQAGVRDTALDVAAAWKEVVLVVALRRRGLGGGLAAAARLGRPARARVRRAGRPLLAAAPVVARRRRDGQGRAVRAPPPPASARRLRARAVRHARPGLVAPDRADDRRSRLRARGLGAGRRVPRAAPVVAGLRRARLVLAAARPRVSLPLGPPGELDPQHRRGEPRPPAGLDVPEPPRDRVHARRRVPAARRSAAEALDDRRGRARVRRASLDAHAGGVHRARPSGSSCSPCSGARVPIAGLAVASVVASVVFVAIFPTIGPSTTYTATELMCLRENAAAEGVATDDPFSAGESSTSSHLTRAAGRDPHRRAAPVGIRARQLGRLRVAQPARGREGGRVELYGARGRHRACSGCRIRRLARRAEPRPAARARRGSPPRSRRSPCSGCRPT